jgi:hypothetical protein
MDEPKKPLSSHPPDVEVGTTLSPYGEGVDATSLSSVRGGKSDLLAQEHTDPVLNAKMGLVNDVCCCYYCCVWGNRRWNEADDYRRLTRLASRGTSGACSY